MAKRRDERGVALVGAIFALLLIGGMVSGAFFVGMQEQRVGHSTLKAQQAFHTAEGAAQYLVADWDPYKYNNLVVGSTLADVGWMDDSTGWYRRSLRRMNTMLYLVDVQGFSADSSTGQHVGLLARLNPVEVRADAAFTTRGNVRARGKSEINGNDRTPPGWLDCPAVEAAGAPGLLVDDKKNVTEEGGAHIIAGNPRIAEDKKIDVAELTTFADTDFDALAAEATKVLPPGTYEQLEPSFVGTECNLADPKNWGDGRNPLSPCGDYYPVTLITGDAVIRNWQGQGLLLVDGDLMVNGNFEYFGVIIVRGRFWTEGTGQKFHGAVIAANNGDGLNDIAGDAKLYYSSCAIQRSLQGTALAVPFGERSWVSLY
jgi:hypothetical protein